MDAHDWTPGTWIGVGFLLVVIAAVIAAGVGDAGLMLLLVVPASVVLTIGVIAKGVEVGMRSARREVESQH